MNNHPQVIDYNRLRRISPTSNDDPFKTEYNKITQVCILFIFIVMYKSIHEEYV